MSGLRHVHTHHSPPHVRRSATTAAKAARSAPSASHKIPTRASKARTPTKVDEDEEIFDFDDGDDMATSFLQYWSVAPSVQTRALKQKILTLLPKRHLREANPRSQLLHPLLQRTLSPHGRSALSNPLPSFAQSLTQELRKHAHHPGSPWTLPTSLCSRSTTHPPLQ